MTYFIATIFNVCATLTMSNWVAAQGKHVLSEIITQKLYWLITVMCLDFLFAIDSLDHLIAFQFRLFDEVHSESLCMQYGLERYV